MMMMICLFVCMCVCVFTVRMIDVVVCYMCLMDECFFVCGVSLFSVSSWCCSLNVNLFSI